MQSVIGDDVIRPSKPTQGASYAVQPTLTDYHHGQITKIVLTIEEGKWQVDIPFKPCSSREGVPLLAKWLAAVDPPQFIPINREESSSSMYVETSSMNLTCSYLN